MKEYARGRKVVIVGGKGNIEQAIFILKKEAPEIKDDYILDEAKRIVDEFVARNGVPVRKSPLKWILVLAAIVCLAVGVWAYIFM